MTTIIRFTDLLIMALLVGTMFGIWIGFNPAHLTASTYVEQQQQSIRKFNTLLPILGAVCILLTIGLAVLARERTGVFYLLVAAIVLMIIAGLVTRSGNQPINSEVMKWSIQAPPANWTVLRDQWWRWHVVRTLAGISALSLLIIAILIDGSPVVC